MHKPLLILGVILSVCTQSWMLHKSTKRLAESTKIVRLCSDALELCNATNEDCINLLKSDLRHAH